MIVTSVSMLDCEHSQSKTSAYHRLLMYCSTDCDDEENQSRYGPSAHNQQKKKLADKYPDVGSSFLHKVKRVASKRRKGADTLTLRSHSGSASSTKTMEEEMETQRHRDTNCQGYRQDTDCQGIGPESVLCFLFI